ncbi:MAG: hypothetical protein HW394_1899 [Acidobacteria bacterium]|nr:hypothetical protein [Acidobacteriota bacterium]
MALMNTMAHEATDLAVTLPEDRPGMLAKALQAVSAAGINLEGHAEMGGVVHVLTTDLDAARDALEAEGFRVVKAQQVVLVEVEDRPGSAARIFHRVADAKVNIRFSYLATRNRLVIGADDLEELRAALSD